MDDEMPGQNYSWDEAGNNVIPFRESAPMALDEAEIARLRQMVQAFDEPEAAAQEREPLKLIDPSDWGDEDPPHRRWAVKDMVPHGQTTFLTGAGSAGKSLVAQLLCTCIALGLPWLGTETEQAVAIYISCEDDADELWRRQKAICEGLGVPLSALKGKLYLLSLVGETANELATFDDRGRLSVAGRYLDIEEACLRVGARFLALDNTGHFFSGNENDRHQVASFLGLDNALAAKINGYVLLIGHPNKAGAQYTGSTAWENQVRSRLFMEVPTDDDGNANDPDARVISRGKSNYAQKGAELHFRWHKWTFVRAEDLPGNTGNELAENAQANAENERFLACLAERTKQKRAVSEQESSPTYAPRIFAKMDVAKGMKVDGFKRAMDRLFRIEAIGRRPLPWNKSRGHQAEGLAISAASHVPDLRPTSDAKSAKSLKNLAPDLASDVASHPAPHLLGDEPPNGQEMAKNQGIEDASHPASDCVSGAAHTPPSTTYVGSPLDGSLSTYEEVEKEIEIGDPPDWMNAPVDESESWRANQDLEP